MLASLVVISHAPEIVDHSRVREPFAALTHTSLSLGDLAVDGFFLLSGYLIVASWMKRPVLGEYLRKRVLRIVPGYLVAMLLGTLAVGLLAPGTADFFRHLDRRFLSSLVFMEPPVTPAVLPGFAPHDVVNAAVWTIGYEFRCYLLVALLGMAGLLRRPWTILLLTVFLVSVTCLPVFPAALSWTHLLRITGLPPLVFRLLSAFLVGGCFYLFRAQIVFRAWGLAACGVGVVLIRLFAVHAFEPALMLAGSYAIFYVGRAHHDGLQFMRKIPDISYGLYLYGWPVEALLLWFARGHVWLMAGVALALSAGLGWLSWHWVEAPALRWKPRAAVVPIRVAFPVSRPAGSRHNGSKPAMR